MRLLVIAPSLANTSPGSRFRIEQWMPYLEELGVSTTYEAFEDDELHQIIYTPGNYGRKTASMLRALGRRVSLLGRAREYDLVFIYEEAARIGPAVVERVIRWLGLPIVYDFCDPVYLPYQSPTNHHLARLKCFGKTATICRLADHVLVGNEDLASYARRYNPRVTVVPLTIDTRAYAAKQNDSRKGKILVIGWSGSHSTVPHLEGLAEVLRAVAKVRRFRLEVIGAPNFRLEGVEVGARGWSLATEISDLHRFDIGIMPLPNDPWTRLRSHLKVRQYMGAGLPSVASPVGVNAQLIRDGVNGFLADGPAGWMEKLVRLIDDPELRLHMGRKARATIEEHYAAETWAPRVLKVLRDAVQRRREPSTGRADGKRECA